MIKNPDLLKKFEDEFIRNEGRLNYRQSLNSLQICGKRGCGLAYFPLKTHWKD